MTSLPRTRPVRRSAKRGELATASDAKASGAKPATRSAKAAKSAKPKAAAKAGAKSKGAKGKAAKGAKAKAASSRAAAQPEQAASEVRSAAAAAQAPPGRPAGDVSRSDEAPPPPKRKVPAAGYAAPSARTEEPENAVADLVSTTVQAARELAQIGMDVSRAAVRSMRDRLPRA